jgi:hypothetical protein
MYVRHGSIINNLWNVNKRPTNASKIPIYWHTISLLHVLAHQRRHLQGVQYEPAELLSSFMKAEWDEGCIWWRSAWWVLLVEGSIPPHRRSQYTAYNPFRFRDTGQQFSRLILNSLKMAPFCGVPRNLFRGVQQIQLRTEGRENGDLGAVAP